MKNMKKTFLLLPLTAVIVSACTNNTGSAPVEDAGGVLSPGIMQPVDNPSTGGSWEPQVKQGSMPVGMNTPVTTIPSPAQQPTYQPSVINQPVAQSSQQGMVCKPVVKKANNSGVSQTQHFEIPRNATTNAPDYSKIDKGFYKGNSYTVKKGDTMFLIAYIAGIDVKELASLNGMKEPYTLSVGQTLKVSHGGNTITQTQECVPTAKPVEPSVTYTQGPNGTQYGSDGTITGPVKAGVGSNPPTQTPSAVTTGSVAMAGTVAPTVMPSTTAPISSINWQWPTSGKVVQGFSSADGGNKGIDISGSKGQEVIAAAAGRVVYAGNALRGYGNLIIIKHNDDFLSAYAHNDSLLVSDQQEVKAGQQIAKMGNTGTDSTKLHFEIRHKGKSVDPMRYLPKR